MIGQTISHYKILEKLGEGGMGVVYKAQDTRLDRTVALKFLPPEFSRDPESKQRFKHEAHAASALEHPNICNIHEIDETPDGQIFIVMAYYEGETLKKKIERGPIAIDQAIDIAIQVAQGLQKAHEHDLVHRDVKPANVMITSDGIAKIVDFGLAKLTGQTQLTKAGTTLGTVAYMSPEQARGGDIDHRTDIWSLGVMMYEMITGQLPFKSEYHDAVVYSILNESPPPITGLRSGVPMELERIVNKCMEKKPADRYQHMDEIATDLRGLKQGVTVGLEKAAPPKPRPPVKRRTYVYVSLGVLAIMVAAVIMLLRPTTEKIGSLAVLPLKNLSGDLEQEWFVEGMHDALIGELAQISALRVISRTSVMRYKGGSKAVPEIAQELDVDAVVEGTVFRAGDSVRIQVQLIRARPERHLWAQSYERDLRNVLALHREVARTIADQIRVKLTPQEAGRLASAHPVNPEAHEAYLRGKYYLNQFTPEALNKSMEQFQQAIAMDPNFAPAYCGLADAYMTSAMSHGTLLPREGYPKAREAAKRALEIDENLASAHVSLAQTEIFYYWDWSAAERELTRELELDPNNAQAHETYYAYLVIMDRKEEALGEIKRAKKLDPLSLIINADLGVALSLVGQYEQAIKQLQEVLKMNANFPPALWALGNAYFLQEKYEESITWFQKAFASSGEHSSWLGPLGLAYAEAGRKEQALEILEKMKKLYDNRQNISMAFIAGIHEVLGEKEQAFEWLEKAIREHDVQAPFYKLYNMFKSLRSDPRFKILVKKMNLQE